MLIQPGLVLMELHDGSVGAVDMHGGFDGRVHRDAVDLSHSGHRQNVGKGGGVEPHVSDTVPISVEVWVPPFVCTRNAVGLFRMFERSSRFLKTETVD